MAFKMAASSVNNKDDSADLETSNNYDNASTAGIIRNNKNKYKNNKTRFVTRVLCSACGVATILVFYIFCGAIVFLSLENVSYNTETKSKRLIYTFKRVTLLCAGRAGRAG